MNAEGYGLVIPSFFLASSAFGKGGGGGALDNVEVGSSPLAIRVAG